MEFVHDFIEERSRDSMGQASIIFFSLFVMTNRIATDVDNSLDDLTLKQLMLLILIEITEGGSYTELGELMGSSRQNIKNLARTLEKKGYVSILTDSKDRRASRVISTGKTKNHFTQEEILYDTKLNDLFSYLNAEEINQLFILMEKILKGLEKMEDNDETH